MTFKVEVLPTWEECRDKVASGQRMSTLEVFIYDHEPPYHNARRWRQQLAEILVEAHREFLNLMTTAA